MGGPRAELAAAELRQKRILRDPFRRLLIHLCPLGRPQERVYGFLGFLSNTAPARGHVTLEA